MSAYKVIECHIQKEEHVIAALIDMGIPKSAIEIHETPTNLYGYRGDKRTTQAHVVVRRKHVNQYLSNGLSNDIGFEKIGDTYEAHISDYDSRWWKIREPRFRQVVATHHVTDKAKRKGYHVKKIEDGSKIRLKLTKNY